MKVMEKNVMRLAAVQHLRTAFGIKTKHWNKNKTTNSKTRTNNLKKVFGVSLESLPYYNMEGGCVPSFLVDACMKLLAHIDTEGLFRKSGSVIRMKELRAKLDAGEGGLSTALPCDVAGLVKQFFRELPEPILPKELQEAFLKAQQLPAEEDRTSATMLLTCVLPEKNQTILHYFFDFLHNVSKRCSENKMDSDNLSVIFAPNLLHFGDGTEKMNANTERCLKLQAAVVHCLIENAHTFGVLPHFLQEKVSGMMGCDAGDLSLNHDALEEDLHAGMKRRHRRSFGVFSSATPVIATPTSKRKEFPLESGNSFGFSNKKRRSVKKTLGIDLLPNTLFSGTSTPGSVHSASGVLDSSENTLSSAGRLRKQAATSGRRKNRRLSSRHAVNRVESGRAGCFSPKTSVKEAQRKSLRLRFSLGKSSKDAGSESIGWRLATQESTTTFCFTKEMEFNPSVLPGKAESKGSNYMSKSADDLLTPQCDSRAHQASWSGKISEGTQAWSHSDTPMSMNIKSSCMSEPSVVLSKPPAAASLPRKLCCTSSSEVLDSESPATEAQHQTGPAPLRVKAFPESGNNPVIQNPCNSTGGVAAKPPDYVPVFPPETSIAKAMSVDTEASTFPSQQILPTNNQDIAFGHCEIAALSLLHIDSGIFETGVYSSSPKTANGGSSCPAKLCGLDGSVVEESGRQAEQLNCRRLIDILDIQSPVAFKRAISSGLQSTPCKLDQEPEDKPGTPSVVHEETKCCKIQKHHPLPRPSPGAEKRHVADHIQHFNKLTLCPPIGFMARQIRSPLKFQRTPVRQTVRRINSLLTDSKRPSRNAKLVAGQRNEVGKALSLESGLSTHPQSEPHQAVSKKKPPPVPPKTTSTLTRNANAIALGDVTNTVQLKTKLDSSVLAPPGTQKVVQPMAEKEMSHYRGSPRNPLHQGRLLSATKPVDL